MLIVRSTRRTSMLVPLWSGLLLALQARGEDRLNVSLHARGQLLGRMPAPEAIAIIKELEAARAPKRSEARIIRRFDEQRTDGQSNGDLLLAIIERGTVVTCYWRRSTQTLTAEGFRVDILRDFTRTEAEQKAIDEAALAANIARLQAHFGGGR